MSQPPLGLIALRMIAIVVGPLGCSSDNCEALLNCEPFTAVDGEFCENDIDDNKDTRTDCADPECEFNYQCISAVPPTGFTGYYRIRTSSYSSAPPPPCADGSSPVTYFAGQSTLQCSACTCEVLEQPSCSPPPALCWFNSDCSGVDRKLRDDISVASCEKPYSSTYLSCQLTSPTPSMDNPGSCIPSGGDLIGKPWETQIHACVPARGGCPAGEVCWPRTAVASSWQLCILGEGTRICPAQWPMPVTAFGGLSDTPSCSACSCKSACNGGGYRFYPEDGCSGSSVDLDTACRSLVSDGTWGVYASPPSITACAPNGGDLGYVFPVNPVTFCCQS